jgi:hypothetical protein
LGHPYTKLGCGFPSCIKGMKLAAINLIKTADQITLSWSTT